MESHFFENSRILSKLKEKTSVPAIKITPSQKGHLSIFQSKFGGVPYWNLNKPYPVSSDGKKLVLLAQLNMEEVPPLDDFPMSGILQFFISQGNMYGLDFSNQTKQDFWRVVYHEKVSAAVTENSVLDLGIPVSYSLGTDEIFPFSEEFALSFQKTETFLGIQSYDRFMNVLKELGKECGVDFPDDFDPYESFGESFGNEVSNCNVGHWLGGYPNFMQEDPRNLGHECDTLLFQMDSDSVGNSGIMWGDMGTANFFISKDALLRCDFSKVLYNWDCC